MLTHSPVHNGLGSFPRFDDVPYSHFCSPHGPRAILPNGSSVGSNAYFGQKKANRAPSVPSTPVKSSISTSSPGAVGTPATPQAVAPATPVTPSSASRPTPGKPIMSPFTAQLSPEHEMYALRKEQRKRAVEVRTMDEVYEKKDEIGQGTYGKVYKAVDKTTKDTVALKKFRMENEKDGFPITAIREIKLLKSLSHPNVVKLREIVVTPATDYNRNMGDIYLAFDYSDHDLTGLQDMGVQFTPAQIKLYMRQVLSGLQYLHSENVLHRDIKGSNMLVGNDGMVRIADFGLARKFNKDKAGHLTNNVITLWYRPPELLMGAREYGPAVDVWSAGCLLGELLLRRPLFPGKDEMDQLDHIFRVCGTPTRENWPDHSSLPEWQKRQPAKALRRMIAERFQSCSPKAIDLLEKMLTLDPKARITATEALGHDFFTTEEPLPMDPSSVPVYNFSAHELEAKNFNKKKQAQRRQVNVGKPAVKRSRIPAIGRVSRIPAVGGNAPAVFNGNGQPPLPPRSAPALPPPPPPQSQPPPPPPAEAALQPQSSGGFEVEENDAKRRRL